MRNPPRKLPSSVRECGEWRGGGRGVDCNSNSEIMKTWTKSVVSHDTLCTSL